jgi:hypothetical protein
MTINDAKYIFFKQLLNTLREYYPKITMSQCNESFQWSIISNTFIIYLPKYKGELQGEVGEDELKKLVLDFEISYEISVTPSLAADIMRVILTVVEPYDIATLEEFFYDFQEEQIYIGDEAAKQKVKVLQKKLGKVLCPCCERYVVEKMITDSGFCGHCNEHIGSINFH